MKPQLLMSEVRSNIVLLNGDYCRANINKLLTSIAAANAQSTNKLQISVRDEDQNSRGAFDSAVVEFIFFVDPTRLEFPKLGLVLQN